MTTVPGLLVRTRSSLYSLGVMDSTSPPRTAVRAVKSRRRKPSSYPCQSPLSWGVPRRRATSTRFFRMGRRKGLVM